jgi:uncharacterized membrane protein YeaQ/YmgE (transglycosylase-associated protein family)
MAVLGSVAGYLALGVLVGLVGRRLPRRAIALPVSFALVLGTVGAVVGGLVARVVLSHGHQPLSFVAALGVAILLVALPRRERP